MTIDEKMKQLNEEFKEVAISQLIVSGFTSDFKDRTEEARTKAAFLVHLLAYGLMREAWECIVNGSFDSLDEEIVKITQDIEEYTTRANE